MMYRRLKGSLDLDWHFHAKCPRWPELGLVDIQLFKPEDERLCPECIKLEAAVPPRKPPKDD